MEKFYCQAECGRCPPEDEKHIVEIMGKRMYICDDCYREYVLDQECRHGEKRG